MTKNGLNNLVDKFQSKGYEDLRVCQYLSEDDLNAMEIWSQVDRMKALDASRELREAFSAGKNNLSVMFQVNRSTPSPPKKKREFLSPKTESKPLKILPHYEDEKSSPPDIDEATIKTNATPDNFAIGQVLFYDKKTFRALVDETKAKVQVKIENELFDCFYDLDPITKKVTSVSCTCKDGGWCSHVTLTIQYF
jgi:hypothetical protein